MRCKWYDDQVDDAECIASTMRACARDDDDASASDDNV